MSSHPNRSAEVVIIGAGLAGAATAFFLTRRGLRDVLLLERELTPGLHASGRNAAMVRQVVPDPEIAVLARQGAAFIRDTGESLPHPTLFRQHGSFLLGSEPEWASLCRDATLAQEAGLPVECLDVREVIQRLPVLKDARFEGAIWCPTDGVVDVAALLEHFLALAQKEGARVRTDCLVIGLEFRSGRVAGVRTAEGPIRSPVVVNAAGAWAGELGCLAGATPIPITPYRRHLFITGPLDWVTPGWPFVWDVSHHFYFRPESGGLLLCPCDETPWPPGTPPVEPQMADLLAERVTRYVPGLRTIALRRSWAGLRTFTEDRRFAIGWDPLRAGFFWVAGLGGHGVTVSSAVGALAADLILAGPKSSGGPFDPARFLSGPGQ